MQNPVIFGRICLLLPEGEHMCVCIETIVPRVLVHPGVDMDPRIDHVLCGLVGRTNGRH